MKRPKLHLYIPSAYWAALPYHEQALHLIRATATRHPHWTFCYLSAALLWGLTQTVFIKGQMHIAAKNHTHTRVGGSIKFHYCLVDKGQVRANIPVTGLLQTVYDCARRLDYPNGLAICDKAMRLYGITRQQLMNYANLHSRSWGRERAIYVFSQASPLSESSGESIARALFDGWGYARPKQQVTLPSPLRAGKTLRPDFIWQSTDNKLVAGELDGREKYTNPLMTGGRSVEEVVLEEKDRETELSLLGYVIIRFNYHQLRYKRGKDVRRKLKTAKVPLVNPNLQQRIRQLFGCRWGADSHLLGWFVSKVAPGNILSARLI